MQQDLTPKIVSITTYGPLQKEILTAKHAYLKAYALHFHNTITQPMRHWMFQHGYAELSLSKKGTITIKTVKGKLLSRSNTPAKHMKVIKTYFKALQEPEARFFKKSAFYLTPKKK